MQCDDSKRQSIIQINQINPNPMMSVLRVLKYDFHEGMTMKRKVIPEQSNKTSGCQRFENCVLCGKQTYILVDVPITARQGYIEGVGQLCAECNHKIKTDN